MENWDSPSLKSEIIEYSQPPNVILKNITKKLNYEYPSIITKKIKFNNNPINKINYDCDERTNMKYIKKRYIKFNSNNNILIKNNNSHNSRNNINVYTKKKLSDVIVTSSATSGINSILSNTQKNNILNNIEYVENTTNNNMNTNNINNIYNIKTTNNKSTNILIKNIYSNDDYFNANINEGLLHLKDFEIYKSDKISQFDIENEKNQNNQNKKGDTIKSLSQILIKSEKKKPNRHLARSCDSKNRNKKFKSRENILENKKLQKQLSIQLYSRKIKRNGKVSNLMNCFHKQRNILDKIIVRGTRNEKGGVVDFTTASPKKFYKTNNYIIHIEKKNKNLYKYPKWKIISSAKIIQYWWKGRMIIYFEYLNKIRRIQKNFKLYLAKKENEINNIIINEREKIINKNKLHGIIILKKVIEVKLYDLFFSILLNMKNIINKEQNKAISLIKYTFLIESIIIYIKILQKKYIYSFLLRLKRNRNYKTYYLKSINASNIYIKSKKIIPIKEKQVNKIIESNSNYYGLNYNYNNQKRNKYTAVETLKIYNIIYKIILRSIIDKIKKEANRRTIIKAFRNINKMKYPILFYSLVKLHKYSVIKYNVMNSYAIFIQRCYRDFMNKKYEKCNFYY